MNRTKPAFAFLIIFCLFLVTSCSNSNKSSSTTNTSNPQTSSSQKQPPTTTTTQQQPSTPPTASNNTPAQQPKQPQQQVNSGTPTTTSTQSAPSKPETAAQTGKGQEKKYTPTVGSEAPPFTLFTLDNQQVSPEQFKGKTLFLQFWASWCGKCNATAPELNKFYANHPKDVAIIAINLNQADTFEGINEYVQRFKITFPVGVDLSGDITTLYRVSQTSTYFVIDPQGVIRQIFTYQTLTAKDFETAYAKAQQPNP